MQPRASERKPAFEESPDTEEQGGRDADPGKPAGKCHRKDTAQVADGRASAGPAAAGKGEKVR